MKKVIVATTAAIIVVVSYFSFIGSSKKENKDGWVQVKTHSINNDLFTVFVRVSGDTIIFKLDGGIYNKDDVRLSDLALHDVFMSMVKMGEQVLVFSHEGQETFILLAQRKDNELPGLPRLGIDYLIIGSVEGDNFKEGDLRQIELKAYSKVILPWTHLKVALDEALATNEKYD